MSETRQEYESKVDLLCEWADAYYDVEIASSTDGHSCQRRC